MLYSDVLRTLRRENGQWTADVPEDWLQGRSVFGGLQTALAARALRDLVPADVPLRTVQTTFMAPVPAGRVTLEARVLRTGRSAVHAEARIVDGAQCLCLVVGVFGTARASTVRRVPAQPAVEAASPIEVKYVPGVMPAFTQHCPMRWLRGTPPFTGAAVADHVIEVALRDGGATASEAHVIGIADIVPPVALSWMTQPAMGSSMTWTLEFLGEPFGHLPLERWRIDSTLVAARDGYTSQSVMVWGPGGEPVALSRQAMVVFG